METTTIQTGRSCRQPRYRFAVIAMAIAASAAMGLTAAAPANELQNDGSQVSIQGRGRAPHTEGAHGGEVAEGVVLEVTAYNAGDPAQTDDSPCISANGEDICTALAHGHKRCAANFVPFGTRLHIQNFGECLVVDRMNARYHRRVDIAMNADEKQRAIRFGVQNLLVKVIK